MLISQKSSATEFTENTEREGNRDIRLPGGRISAPKVSPRERTGYQDRRRRREEGGENSRISNIE